MKTFIKENKRKIKRTEIRLYEKQYNYLLSDIKNNLNHGIKNTVFFVTIDHLYENYDWSKATKYLIEKLDNKRDHGELDYEYIYPTEFRINSLKNLGKSCEGKKFIRRIEYLKSKSS